MHGIHGAKAAGMRVIGFTGAAHTYPGHADMLTEAALKRSSAAGRTLRGVVGCPAEWTEDA